MASTDLPFSGEDSFANESSRENRRSQRDHGRAVGSGRAPDDDEGDGNGDGTTAPDPAANFLGRFGVPSPSDLVNPNDNSYRSMILLPFVLFLYALFQIPVVVAQAEEERKMRRWDGKSLEQNVQALAEEYNEVEREQTDIRSDVSDLRRRIDVIKARREKWKERVERPEESRGGSQHAHSE